MMVTRIPGDEYQVRWTKAQKACKDLDLEGLVIWSRGGHTLDSYSDVFYLSNHYGRFGMAPDFPPHWVGRSHSAIILPVSGEPTLVVDEPDWRRDLVAIDDVRFGINMPDAVAAAVQMRGLASARLGLVGGSAMLASPYRHFLAALPGVEFSHVDEAIQNLRVIKSERELDIIRETFEVGNGVVDAMFNAALKPGTTEAEAVAAGFAYGIPRGLHTYDNFTASGPNSHYFAYGRLPSWTERRLETGDLFHIDCVGAVNGYLYDYARTLVVGGRPSASQLEILETAIQAVDAGIACLRPGIKGSAIFHAVHQVIEEHGMAGQGEDAGPDSTPALLTMFPPHGHGIGVGWEWPWFIPEEERELQPNMVLAVEAMLGLPDIGSAYIKQNVILTNSGVEVLSNARLRFW
jgi:Xaa-Pro aminopeptidase